MGDWYRRRWEPESRDSSRRFELHTGGDGRRDHQRGPLRPRADDFFEDNGGAEERRNPRYQSSLLPESQHQTTSQQTQDPRKLLARGVDGSSAFGQDKDAAHRTGLENKRGNHATEQEQARRAYTQPPALVPKHGRNDREESANQTQVLRAGPVDSSEKRREPGMMDESTLNRGPWSEAQPNSRDAMKVPPSQTSKTTASDTMGRDEKNHKSKRKYQCLPTVLSACRSCTRIRLGWDTFLNYLRLCPCSLEKRIIIVSEQGIGSHQLRP